MKKKITSVGVLVSQVFSLSTILLTVGTYSLTKLVGRHITNANSF